MNKPKSIYTKTAKNAIHEMLEKGNANDEKSKSVPKVLAIKKACFVTLKNSDNSLRGCIGTLSPQYTNLMLEIIHNAVSAAFMDSRFHALTKKEAENIIITVEVLETPQEIENIESLNSEVYGVIVSDNNYRKGVLLPNIEGVDTISKQLEIAKKKAGININEKNIKIERFTTTKHY